jgi:glycosyltransferase involved in cell wall biosynthesis
VEARPGPVSSAGDDAPAVGHGGRPLRVLRIVTRLNVGGPARQILALEPAMARRRVRSLLVSGTVNEDEADLADLLHYPDVRRVPRLQREPSPPRDLAALADLWLIVVRYRPDVVHTHMAKAGTLGRAAALLARVPVRVHTFHGHTLEGYFTEKGKRRVVRTERQLARFSSALVAVSRSVADDLLGAGVGRPDQYRVMSPGLDLGPFLRIAGPDGSVRARLGIPDGAPVIGFSARLVPVKAVNVFLAALEVVLTELPEAHAVIAGDGPEGERITAAQSSAAGERIHWMGWLADMAAFYADVDVVALSSVNEGTPISLIEAAAAGRPVVATAVGGVPEVVIDGETGALVASGDHRALAARILGLARDPARRASMGAAARARSARYSAETLADESLSLYRELIRKRRTGPADGTRGEN